jgi:cobalt-precorrin-5B (C1)-methyltransferase
MALIDPINKFRIPQEWINKTNIPLDELTRGVSSGLLVVLSNGNILHRGFTTGTTAAAAAKAAVLSLVKQVDSVSVPTPSGIRARLDVRTSKGKAQVEKISGDHESDATRGLIFRARAVPSSTTLLIANKGIGIVTRDGLQAKKGYPAINPVPKAQIMDAINEALEETGYSEVTVTISIPDGEKIGATTLNPVVGVMGGISILGTTGFVEPWSDHLGETKIELINNASRVVLTTGRTGMRYSEMLFPDHTVVMMGSRLDEGLKACKGETVICGLPGLILKWAVPDILYDTEFNTVQELVDANRKDKIIDSAILKVVEKSKGARVVLVDRDGVVIRNTGDEL